MASETNESTDPVILITGATDGLGKLVARDLATGGATVLLHGRNPAKGEAMLREIRDATGNDRLAYYNADLSSLDAVRELADRVQADRTHLNVLINNAAVGSGSHRDRRETSPDGYELRFAVNYLAPFLLTRRLLPLLLRSQPGRIVNVGSAGQQRIDFADVMLEHDYDGLRAYRQSKLALVMLTFDLAEELADTHLTVNCVHPASLMDTKMVREADYFGSAMTTVRQGADAVEYVAASVELDTVTGEYFDGMRRAYADPQAYDRQARLRLRALSEQWTSLMADASSA
jgi:NAD(P)-dependent dehydrogenase (short-subunit alcohol dehydrogenase family)